MNWVKVTDGQPNDGEEVVAWFCELSMPLWAECVFTRGAFMMLDHRTEDYTHRLDNVTHWLRIVPPNN